MAATPASPSGKASCEVRACRWGMTNMPKTAVKPCMPAPPTWKAFEAGASASSGGPISPPAYMPIRGTPLMILVKQFASKAGSPKASRYDADATELRALGVADVAALLGRHFHVEPAVVARGFGAVDGATLAYGGDEDLARARVGSRPLRRRLVDEIEEFKLAGVPRKYYQAPPPGAADALPAGPPGAADALPALAAAVASPSAARAPLFDASTEGRDADGQRTAHADPGAPRRRANAATRERAPDPGPRAPHRGR